MAVWLVRAGKYGQDEAEALEKGLAILGSQEMPDLSGIPSYAAMTAKVQEVYPASPSQSIVNQAAQL